MANRSTTFVHALSDRRASWAAVAFAAVVSVSVLSQGFDTDDHVLRSLLLRLPPWAALARSPLDVFTFYDGDPIRTSTMVERFGPWWTDPHLTIAFFRPLSAATHAFDFALWPDVPAIAHAHSLLWYLALVAAAASLYRRLLGDVWPAGFAALAYACDHTHGWAIEWIANRNALVAAFFGVLAVRLYADGRRLGSASRTGLSAASLAVALAGGELAIGAAGYLVAHAWFLDDARGAGRVRPLAPHGAVLATWALVYVLGGYGANGSDAYVDPVRSPLAFAAAAAKNLPLLVQAELGGVPPEFVPPTSAAWWPLLAFAVVVVVGSAVALARTLRAREARFFLAGGLLSAMPIAGAVPTERLMLLPSVGVMGLVALTVRTVSEDRARRRGVRWAEWAFAACVGGGHLILSPLRMQLSTRIVPRLEQTAQRLGDTLPDAPEIERRHVLVVNSPNVLLTTYIPWQRTTERRHVPLSLFPLASGRRAVEIERRDVKTILVRSEGGFYRSGFELLTRRATSPMPVGTRVDLSFVSVLVTRTNEEGVPTEAAFSFLEPLEATSLSWVEWRDGVFLPFTPPPIGGRVRVEGRALRMF